MTTPTKVSRTRAPVRAVIAGTAALLLAACTPDAGPAPPTLDEALEATALLTQNEENLRTSLVTPHAGRGSATYDVPADDGAPRGLKLTCLSDGPLTIRIDGTERSNVPCEDRASSAMGVGGADEDGSHSTNAPFTLEIVADDDLYWTMTVFSTT